MIGEVVLAYAIPAYFWLWGLIMLPFWVLSVTTGGDTAVWYLASMLGGFVGMIGIVAVLTQIVSERRRGRLPFICFTILCSCGVFAIWTVMTDRFQAFEVNWFSLLGIVAPTACTIHLLVLYGRPPRRSRTEKVCPDYPVLDRKSVV